MTRIHHERSSWTVLPTLDERGNIAPLVMGLLEACGERHRVIVVDDASPDGTAESAAELAERHGAGDRVLVVRREHERGLTSAIQRGIDEALQRGAEVVTWMDADLSMPVELVPRLMATLGGGADVAVGSRWMRGGRDLAHPFPHRFLSRLWNAGARLALNSGVRDLTSGFVAARADVLRALRLRGDYGEYCVDVLVRAERAGFHVVEVPYVFRPRAYGTSKTGTTLVELLRRGGPYTATVVRMLRER